MPARIILLVTSPRLPAGLLTAAAWDVLRRYPVYAAAPAPELTAQGITVTVTERPLDDLLAGASSAGASADVTSVGGISADSNPADDSSAGGASAGGASAGGASAGGNAAGGNTADGSSTGGAPAGGASAGGAPAGGNAAGGASAGGASAGGASADGSRVWLAGPTGDEALARELGMRLAREPGLAELELMYGSWDPPGARLLDAVTVMDRLASPGGDPWKRAQTHESLAHFLLEEAYEAYDAIMAGDSDALREELGDVLLQVVLHARLAENLPEDRAWTVDDLAGELVEKLVRRNPHVFDPRVPGEPTQDVDEIIEQWERIKKAEKRRDSVLDGIALAQPSLALAAKVLARSGRAGVVVPLPDGGTLGERLLRLVATEPEDAEGALRAATLAYAQQVRDAERAGRELAGGE